MKIKKALTIIFLAAALLAVLASCGENNETGNTRQNNINDADNMNQANGEKQGVGRVESHTFYGVCSSNLGYNLCCDRG